MRGINLDIDVTDETLPTDETFDERLNAIPGIAGWFTFSDLEYLTLDGSNRASAVSDRTAAATTLTQSTSGKRPLWLPEAVGEEGGLEFLLSRPDGLVWSDTMDVGSGAKWSKVMVFKGPASNPSALRLMFGDNNTGGQQIYIAGDGTLRNFLSTTSSKNIGTRNVCDDEYHWCVATYDESAGSLKLKVDNLATEVSTFTPVTTTNGNVAIGASSITVASFGYTGVIADVLMFNGIDLLATANASYLTAVQEYVASVYGLDV